MTTTSYRPLDGQVAGSVVDSTPDQVDAVVAAAEDAAATMAAASPRQRSEWIESVAHTLEDHADQFVRLADTETGLGTVRLTGELARAAAQLRFYASVACEGSYLGVTVDNPTPTSPRLVRVNQPLGPVAVFGASNFPFGFGALGNDTASALAAGCPVVVKAHPAHVQLSVRLAELAQEALAAAGAPRGSLGHVVGMEAGVRLVQAPGIKAVGFTGSQDGGLALWDVANERDEVIPIYAEMGTVNPVVMTRAAAGDEQRAEEIAAGFVGSFTLGSGQFCTKPGLLLAPAGHELPQLVATALENAAPAPVMLTSGIAEHATTGVEALTTAGADVVGRVAARPEGWSTDAVVLSAPAAALAPDSPLLSECFGPVAVVVEYADNAERDELLARLQGSLAGTVATDGSGQDPDAGALVQRLAGQVGRVTIDDWPTGVAWTWAQQHGGPWPATSRPESTSVGAAALDRWVRPVAFQSTPDAWLPPAGRGDNPWGVPQRVDGELR
jgi:NADP-dependent aldehyde dehydrogenase